MFDEPKMIHPKTFLTPYLENTTDIGTKMKNTSETQHYDHVTFHADWLHQHRDICPRNKKETYIRFIIGDRAFGASGPSVWNSLPTKLRQSDLSLGQFRRELKTFLF